MGGRDASQSTPITAFDSREASLLMCTLHFDRHRRIATPGQNPELYALYDSELERIGMSEDAKENGTVRQTQGWHGTSGFPAENIYNDVQVCF
eukprot:COSAG02_NODE_2251_length_9362_cov_19.062075_4_plen_93_part_00